MKPSEFSDVIASARKRASEGAPAPESDRGPLLEAIKSKQEVLHTVVNFTLLQAWRDLQAADVKATVDAGTNARGDWQMALRILSVSDAQALVFTVQEAKGAPLVFSREKNCPSECVDYTEIEEATPVNIAQIVADYLSETLG